MAMIRRELVTGGVRDALVMDMGDIERRADEVRAHAAAEAERLLAAARSEAERIRERAHAEARASGLAEGRAAGLAEGREGGHAEALAQRGPELEALAARWAECLDAIEAQREELARAARTEVVRLAAEVARKVVARVVELDASVVEDQLAEAVRLVTAPSRVVVAVHPEDRARAEEALPALLRRFGTSPHTELVADASLSRGSVVLRTGGGGVIDASVAGMLDRVVAALLPGPMDVEQEGTA